MAVLDVFVVNRNKMWPLFLTGILAVERDSTSQSSTRTLISLSFVLYP